MLRKVNHAQGPAACAGAALAALLLSGCFKFAQLHAYEKDNFHRYPKAEIITKGVEIAAEDGSFKWVAGSTYDTPAQCVGDSNEARLEIFPWENRGNALSEDYQYVGPTAESYPVALKYGAKRVRVTYPGLPEPLYGVLMINCQHEFPPQIVLQTSPIQIEVPQQYVDATTDGRKSLVFEKTSGNEAKWGIWLSRQPLK